MKEPKALLVVGQRVFLEDVRRRIGPTSAIKILAETSAAADAPQAVGDKRVSCAIVECLSGEFGDAVAVASALPGVAVLAACDRPDLALWRRARSLGLAGALPRDFDLAFLEKALAFCDGPAGAAAPCPVESEDALRCRPADGRESWAAMRGAVFRQEVVVFCSSKGGVGKTTLALNLAAACASAGRRTAVLEFAHYGTAASLLQIDPALTLADWDSLAGEPVGPQVLQDYFVKHACGFWLLPAPRRLKDAELVTARAGTRALESAAALVDVVIVDTSPVPSDLTVLALRSATRVFVVATVDVPALRAVRDFCEVLDLLEVAPGRAACVLNRVPARPTVPLDRALECLVRPLAAKVPEDPRVQELQDRGALPAAVEPQGAFALAVQGLLASRAESAGVSRGRFAWMLDLIGRSASR